MADAKQCHKIGTATQLLGSKFRARQLSLIRRVHNLSTKDFIQADVIQVYMKKGLQECLAMDRVLVRGRVDLELPVGCEVNAGFAGPQFSTTLLRGQTTGTIIINAKLLGKNFQDS
jgi:hypothetical protein